MLIRIGPILPCIPTFTVVLRVRPLSYLVWSAIRLESSASSSARAGMSTDATATEFKKRSMELSSETDDRVEEGREAKRHAK